MINHLCENMVLYFYVCTHFSLTSFHYHLTVRKLDLVQSTKLGPVQQSSNPLQELLSQLIPSKSLSQLPSLPSLWLYTLRKRWDCKPSQPLPHSLPLVSSEPTALKGGLGTDEICGRLYTLTLIFTQRNVSDVPCLQTTLSYRSLWVCSNF